jgi:hypothetical protein
VYICKRKFELLFAAEEQLCLLLESVNLDLYGLIWNSCFKIVQNELEQVQRFGIKVILYCRYAIQKQIQREKKVLNVSNGSLWAQLWLSNLQDNFSIPSCHRSPEKNGLFVFPASSWGEQAGGEKLTNLLSLWHPVVKLFSPGSRPDANKIGRGHT